MSIIRTVRILRTFALSIVVSSAVRAGTIASMDGNITVTDVVTPISGGLFQYNYTVSDASTVFGSQGLVVLDIAVAPGVSISGLTAPGGSSAFTSTISTVGFGSSQQEFVSFIENNGVFTAAPLSGFIFDSSVGPMPTTFGVTLSDGTTGTAGGITGPATPEPASISLSAFGVAALVFWRKKLFGPAASKVSVVKL